MSESSLDNCKSEQNVNLVEVVGHILSNDCSNRFHYHRSLD